MPFQLSFWLTRGRGSRRTCRRSVTFGFPSLVFAVPGSGNRSVNVSWPTPVLVGGLLTGLSLSLAGCGPFTVPDFHRAWSLLWTALTSRGPPPLLLAPSEEGSARPVRCLAEPARSPWVTHVSVPTIPPPTTYGGSCAGLHLLTQAGPPVAAESRSLSLRASLWLGPFTGILTEDGCRCLLGVLLLHRSPRRDLNPLETCAARRTQARVNPAHLSFQGGIDPLVCVGFLDIRPRLRLRNPVHRAASIQSAPFMVGWNR